MTTSKWYQQAARVIRAALAEGQARALTGKDLLAHIDAAYPFGERAYTPYKQWLKARKNNLAPLGLVEASKPSKREAKKLEAWNEANAKLQLWNEGKAIRE